MYSMLIMFLLVVVSGWLDSRLDWEQNNHTQEVVMITGHFGLGAGVKKIVPRLPLWSLLLAPFWLDIIFTIFSMLGLESFWRYPLGR